MKKIIPAVSTSIILTISTFAMAQVPAPAPARTPAKTATKTTPPAPAKNTSSAKNTSPAKTTSPAKAATPAPVKTPSKPAIKTTTQATAKTPEQQVAQARTEVFQSIVQRDAALYDQRVADDAILVGFAPGVSSKFSAFSTDMPADMKVQAFRVNNMRVKIEGETAVVIGRVWLKALRQEKTTNTTSEFMNVFARRDNRWQLIAAHLTAL